MKQILRTHIHTGEQLGGPPKPVEQPPSLDEAVAAIDRGAQYEKSTIRARLEAGQVLSDGKYTYQLIDVPDEPPPA